MDEVDQWLAAVGIKVVNGFTHKTPATVSQASASAPQQPRTVAGKGKQGLGLAESVKQRDASTLSGAAVASSDLSALEKALKRKRRSDDDDAGQAVQRASNSGNAAVAPAQDSDSDDEGWVMLGALNLQ